ncbi:MAG TPA: hypothetical protein VMU75_09390, partial [Acidimicrobiales bacterium]|nr:hypothetical protein [Acidimicrobiales bacterium]
VTSLGVPTAYLPHGKPDAILASLGLDGEGIARAVRQGLERLEHAGRDVHRLRRSAVAAGRGSSERADAETDERAGGAGNGRFAVGSRRRLAR